MSIPAEVSDYRELAQRRLPRFLFDYIDGGSHSESTMRANVADLAQLTLRQRVMRDVSQVSTSVDLFGQRYSLPLILAPVGLAGMYAQRGEVQAARAAKAAGVPMCLSSVSICGLDEVAVGAGQVPWLQLYMIKDRGYTRVLLQNAAALGCPVLMFTIDLPVPAPRYRDTRSGFTLPPGWRRTLTLGLDCLRHPRWLWDVMLRGRPHAFGNFAPGIPEARALDDFGGWVARNYEQRLTWDDLAWLRTQWDGPIVVKGLLDVDDAVDALAAGVDGIVVSNHGGRQLDGAPSSISALPAIAEKVAGRVPVLMDGGIRRGADLLRARALGADACLVGRAWAYGLAARGQAGVAHTIDILAQELRTAMILTGCTDIQKVGHSVLTADA